MPRDRRLDAETSAFLTRVMTLGNGTSLPIQLSGHELARLIGVIYKDTGHTHLLPQEVVGSIVPEADYYDTPLTWFKDPHFWLGPDYIELLFMGRQHIPDFNTYLACLAELHKRRKKYAQILSAQPMPTMVQVSPRALLEFGGMPTEALASWLTWRKWFYDLDNRSAQESGLLFEPILAAALGGIPKGAKVSPVKRIGDSSKGRQVDCWKVLPSGEQLAYEFKLRVTIAASGQGRFGEELSFARDCRASGAIPILVVLDPTPNPRLTELQQAFRDAGGEAYVGDAAWQHLEDEAGPTMATFIERYVSRPIHAVSQFSGTTLQDLTVERMAGGHVQLSVGNNDKVIVRREDAALSEDEGGDES